MAKQTVIKGIKCKAYIGALPTTYANYTALLPSFASAHKNIEDMTLKLTKDSEDLNIRNGSGFKVKVSGAKACDVSFSALYVPGDPMIKLLRNSWRYDTPLACYFATGEVKTAGTEGLIGIFEVFDFSLSQPAGASKVSVEMSAVYDTVLDPDWAIVAVAADQTVTIEAEAEE